MKRTGSDLKKYRADQYELDFLKAVARRLPEDIAVMRLLGDLYVRTGAYADGLRIDERLSRLCADDPSVWYNFACSLALSGRTDDALDALSKAVEQGYDDYEWMKKDPDLFPLYENPQFQSILEWLYNTFESISDCDEVE